MNGQHLPAGAAGLGRFSGAASLDRQSDGRPIQVLHGVSRHVLPRPADWPPHAHLTGYWFLEDSGTWQPPAELADFLDAGDPPVYIGFGSMAGRDPRRVTGAVVEGLRLANVRGIIATGWGGLDGDDLPDTIMHITQAPHDWLFPRVSAVVHHGGADTTAAALRAGKPSVICPFIVDRFFWGRRMSALGAGSAPIPQKRLTAQRLAAAIRQVTTDAAVRATAAELGRRISQEDGVADAVTRIEAAMSHTG
jgi:sterol 3beta-glucosyltransferase